jgi:hypothetical protein
MRTYAAVLVLLLALTACGSASSTPGPAAPASAAPARDAWTKVPGVPLSPRTDPVVAWTGREVLVVGGNTGWVCPPNADCAGPTDLATDGAALDPATGEWRPVADAPVGFWDSWGGGWDSAYVDGLLVVRGTTDGRLLGYDVAADRWSVLTPPAGFAGRLSASGERLWALAGSRILSWGPAADDVREEASYTPRDPLQDPQLFVTPAGPVITGVRYDEAAPDEPTLTQADVPDGVGGWRRLVTGQIGWLSHWDGTRLYGVEPGEADGGEVNGWDRAYPFAGTLDPMSGEWQPLDVPRRAWSSSDWWDVAAYDGTRVVTQGRFTDLATATVNGWTDLGRPDSRLTHDLSATWAGDRLFVFGGVDEGRGFESPSPPEAWLWRPPAG